MTHNDKICPNSLGDNKKSWGGHHHTEKACGTHRATQLLAVQNLINLKAQFNQYD